MRYDSSAKKERRISLLLNCRETHTPIRWCLIYLVYIITFLLLFRGITEGIYLQMLALKCTQNVMEMIRCCFQSPSYNRRYVRFCIVGVGLHLIDFLINFIIQNACVFVLSCVCKPTYNPQVILCLLTRCPYIKFRWLEGTVSNNDTLSFVWNVTCFVCHGHALLEAS